MTRSKLREHCFKMLFCADFYPAEEKEEQIDRYFDEPKEDETTPEGVEENGQGGAGDSAPCVI